MIVGALRSSKGFPRLVVDSAFSGDSTPLFSPELALEHESAMLGRASRYHGLSRLAVLDALADLLACGETTEPGDAGISAPDEDDQHLWNLLVAVPDAVLITGDRRLRRNPPPGREVLSPREFVERYLSDMPA